MLTELDGVISDIEHGCADDTDIATLRRVAKGIERLRAADSQLVEDYQIVEERNVAEIKLLRSALGRLVLAANCRENMLGDPCRLLEVQAELRDAAKEGRALLSDNCEGEE